jgi:hypothetical protein
MAVLAATAWGASAHAGGVLFNNFSHGFGSNSNIGWTVSTASSNTGIDMVPAMQFVSSADGDVSQIDLALSHFPVANGGGVDADADVSLWTDAGNVLGANLGTWHVTATTDLNTAGPPITISGITGVHLTGGGVYWLQATASGAAWDAWNWNTKGGVGNVLSNGSNLLAGQTQGAFDVLSTAVPEPATWTVMLLGFGSLGLSLRARRRQDLAAV